jgi:multiple sugar transport system substrate-binding protein
MTMRTTCGLAAMLIASLAFAGAAFADAAFADTMTMWVRASGTDAAAHLVDLWNATHSDKIELTTIPDNQMVTKLATGVQAGEVPDLVSFDLIYMPDFMKAGFLTDLTSDLKANPNYASVAQAYKDIAAYEGKIYGAGFTPDVSILVWNKDLFKKAGLDPDKPPRTIGEIHDDAKKIRALGPDTYGFYFSGACPGCNIFTASPMMVAAGSKMLPANGNDSALTGEGVNDVLEAYKEMWSEGLVPKSAQTDNGANFTSEFKTGKIGIQGTGGFLLSELKKDVPNLNFGVTFLPGAKEGEVSSFVGGDVVAIPKGSKHEALAKQFIAWELTDEAQLEGLAKNNIVPSRPALADNKYFAADPRVVVTAKALSR